MLQFAKGVPEHSEAKMWDLLCIEIDFNTTLKHVKLLNYRDLAKVAAIFPVIYKGNSVSGAVDACLELLATFAFVRYQNDNNLIFSFSSHK